MLYLILNKHSLKIELFTNQPNNQDWCVFIHNLVYNSSIWILLSSFIFIFKLIIHKINQNQQFLILFFYHLFIPLPSTKNHWLPSFLPISPLNTLVFLWENNKFIPTNTRQSREFSIFIRFFLQNHDFHPLFTFHSFFSFLFLSSFLTLICQFKDMPVVINEEQLKRAVAALIKHTISKNENSNKKKIDDSEDISIVVSYSKIPENRKNTPIKIFLPHALFDADNGDEICIFIKDKPEELKLILEKSSVEGVSKVCYYGFRIWWFYCRLLLWTNWERIMLVLSSAAIWLVLTRCSCAMTVLFLWCQVFWDLHSWDASAIPLVLISSSPRFVIELRAPSMWPTSSWVGAVAGMNRFVVLISNLVLWKLVKQAWNWRTLSRMSCMYDWAVRAL